MYLQAGSCWKLFFYNINYLYYVHVLYNYIKYLWYSYSELTYSYMYIQLGNEWERVYVAVHVVGIQILKKVRSFLEN